MSFTSKLAGNAKVEYPKGTLVKDKDVGDYKTYEGTVTIKAKTRNVALSIAPPTVNERRKSPWAYTSSQIGRNMTATRGAADATLGIACCQVRWQAPPITSRSP